MTSSVAPIDSHESDFLPSRRLLWSLRLLCIIALSVSGYLAWTAFNSTEVYGCGGGEVFDCGHVLNSQYSKILGVPVSVPAFALYASMIAVLFFLRPGASAKLIRAGWALLTIGAFSAALAALWFIGIQVFELEHLCIYCLGAHSCGILLAAIILWKRPLGGMMTSSLSTISIASVALMAIIQSRSEPPPTFTEERYDDVEMGIAETDGGEVDAEEFSAPMSFDAPVVAEADVFAPPPGVFAPPPGVLGESAAEEPAVEKPVVEAVVADTTTCEVVPEDFVEGSSRDEEGDDSIEVSEIETGVSETGTEDQDSPAPEPAPSTDDVSPAVSEEVKARAVEAAEAATFLFISPSTASVSSFHLLSYSPGANKDESDDTAKSEDEPSESVDADSATKKPAERLVTVAGKRFTLNTRHWPLLGQPDAKYVFVEMFDYTCPHCRRTHEAIEGALDEMGDDLAIIVLPVPLDGSCNDTVGSTSASHRNACDLAELAVAVWRVAPDKFRAYHDWMFERTRSTSAARAEAEKVVGKAKLDAELALPYAGDYIKRHVDLYKKVGRGTVPKLLFPKSTLTGSITSAKTLTSKIRTELD